MSGRPFLIPPPTGILPLPAVLRAAARATSAAEAVTPPQAARPPRLAALRRAGWQVLQVPRLDDPCGFFPELCWGAGSHWAVVPPEGSGMHGRMFKSRSAAARWAGELLVHDAGSAPA